MLRAARTLAFGIAALGLGALSIAAPYAAGTWAISLVGVLAIVAGAAELLRALRAADEASAGAHYGTAVVAILAGLLLFAAPGLVARAVAVAAALLFIADGVGRIRYGLRRRGPARTWSLLNGLIAFALALLVWRLGGRLGPAVLALAIGARMIAEAWSTLAAREPAQGATRWEPDAHHPDTALGLPASAELERLARAAVESERRRWRIDLPWCATLLLLFFFIHASRMQLDWNGFGIASTAVAVLGDVLMALLIFVLLLLPARLLWRRVTRPIERSAWRRRQAQGAAGRGPIDYLVDRWLEARLQFAARLALMRGSIGDTLWRAVQAGLPLTALLIAVNPMWGFSWYFNTENWVSGWWQNLTAVRTDVWREHMVAAVTAGGDAAALLRVEPPGVAGARDFIFLVVGDCGEGDPSQHVLRDRILLEGQRPEVKFLVVSSDVIYPAGAMRDYEAKFYLPFKGFTKPIYAIPGNHDWFDALDGFTANFLTPETARVALAARRAADPFDGPEGDVEPETLVAEAQRLRALYGVRSGGQRAPYFELHGAGFTLLAADTGIDRRVDPAQGAWLEAALQRAAGNFVMVLLGHPLYAGGHAQDGAPDFRAVHDLLRRYAVPLVMAGDTHDFEYYREPYDGPAGAVDMHHVVNGGGGAYLSIGTALAWPVPPPVATWAFYPSTTALTEKLATETPAWKRPFWWWIEGLHAWPASIEALSGVFDFNRAPFFQSFAEVRVEGSAGRVRLLVHGVDGPLRWRDLQLGGALPPPGSGSDDPVELLLPMPGAAS